MQTSLYLPTTLALFVLHVTLMYARPPEPPPDLYPHSLSHSSQRSEHLILPEQLPGKSLPTLHPRENFVWTLNDGWSFFFTTFAQTLPINEASSVLQSMYAALQTFSRSRSLSFEGSTRDAVSLSFRGLGTFSQAPIYRMQVFSSDESCRWTALSTLLGRLLSLLRKLPK